MTLFPSLKGVPLKRIVRHLYREVVDDAVTDTAAQLSYYFLFALFPFLFFLVTLVAYLPLQGAVESLLERLHYVMPGQALSLVEGHVDSLLNNPRPKLLSLGLLVTLWTASRGVDALRKGLNLAYDVPESRPFWRTQIVAIGMTAAGAILILVAFTAFILGGNLGTALAERLQVGTQFATVWSWLRWPFTATIVMLAVALSYYLLPDVKQKFKYITPGSLTATVLWLLGTWGFTQYVEHFGRFNVTHGSIGGVIVLMVWLYISGLVFLLGGEINAVIEHEAKTGKQKGARGEGEAPLPLEDRPGAMPVGVAKSAVSAERRRRRMRIFGRKRTSPPPPSPPRPPEPDPAGG